MKKKLISALIAFALLPLCVGNTYAWNQGEAISHGVEGINKFTVDEDGDLITTDASIQLDEIADPGNPAANKGYLYVADDAATTTLYFRDSAGTTTNLLGGGGHTLDAAYNGGSTIDVDTLAVTLTVSDTDNNAVLALVQNDSTNDPVALVITSASNAAGTATISIDGQAGTYDIEGTGNVWNMSAAGLLTSVGITSSGVNTFTGAVNFGADGVGHDVIVYSDTAGDNLTFHDDSKTALLTDYEIHVDDGSTLNIGTGPAVGTGDYTIDYSGNNLRILALADVASQAILLGDDTNDLDVIWEGDTNNATVTFNSSEDQVFFNGIDLRFGDSDILLLGDGAANDGDFSVVSTGAASLALTAVADNAGAAFTIGSAANHLDLVYQSTTAGDLVTFDHDNTQIATTDMNIIITDSTQFADNTAALYVDATDLQVAGGAAVIIDINGGAALDPDSRALEIVGTGDDARGIFADVDGATNSVYTFQSGGATATGTAVLEVTSDGTPAAALSSILGVTFTGVDANVPSLLSLAATGTGIDVTGIWMATESNGTTAWNANLQNSADDALGVSLRTHHLSATPTAADEVWFHTIIGEDDGAGDTEYVRLSAQSLLATAGSEDGEYVISVAADNGTLTQALVIGPQLNSANTGISVGSGAATGAVTSEGAFDLLLQTNYGTNSSTITITDGVDGDITLAFNGTGKLISGSGAAAANISSSGAFDLVLETNDGTNSGNITITDGAAGAITITPDTTGLIDLAGGLLISETATAGAADEAISITAFITEVTSDGDGTAHVLADGTEGQMVALTMVTKGAGNSVVTPTNLTGYATITFDTLGDSCLLIFTNASWSIMSNQGCTLA